MYLSQEIAFRQYFEFLFILFILFLTAGLKKMWRSRSVAQQPAGPQPAASPQPQPTQVPSAAVHLNHSARSGTRTRTPPDPQQHPTHRPLSLTSGPRAPFFS